jgi:hypothetical protein
MCYLEGQGRAQAEGHRIWPQQGCGHTPSGPFWAQTSRVASHRLPLVGSSGDGGNFNAKMSVCSFHMGMGNFPRNPLLSTYKRRLPPPHLTTPQGARARQRASLQGLGHSKLELSIRERCEREFRKVPDLSVFSLSLYFGNHLLSTSMDTLS